MVPRLQPGRLARLITALYTAREQQSNGTLGPALLAATEAAGLNLVCSSDTVKQQDNKYNITAALLAPDQLRLKHRKHQHGLSAATSAGIQMRTADVGTTAVQRIGPTDLGCGKGPQRVVCDAPQGPKPRNQENYRLFPLYLIIAGIEQGLQCHMQANMQILSQADFFWGLDWFWTWVGQQLGHYQTVPDVLLQPQSAILLPWLREFHAQHMPDLAEQGYSGVQVVMSGHSLGAVIADTAALMMPHGCRDLPFLFSSVSFESAGVPQAVLKHYGDDPSIPDRIISYLGNPSPVNSLCRHPGTVYHVYANPCKPSCSEIALYSGLDLARCFTLAHLAAAALGMPLQALPFPAAAALGAAASVVDKVALAWQDLVLHHSLAGMSLGFSADTGRPFPAAVQPMADWPLFSPAIGTKLPRYLIRDLLSGMLLPSLVDSRNRGVQMLVEGSQVRHMRLVRQLPGYVPL